MHKVVRPILIPPLAALLLLVCVPQPAPAIPASVLVIGLWLADYLGCKLIDEVVDRVTGQPNPKELDKRLRQLETDATLHSEMREEIRKLRLSIDDRVTREEFMRRAEATVGRLREIETRLLATEMLLERQDVRIKDLEDGKGGASSGVPATFLRRGDAFLQNGDHQRAIANYCIAVELAPKDAMPHAGLGRAFAARKDYRTALVCYCQALALAPTDAVIYRDRAAAHYELGHHELAVHDCDDSLKRDANQAATYRVRGMARWRLGQHAAAVEDFSTAIRLDPRDSAARYHRGALLWRLGQCAPAIEDLGVAIALSPANAAGPSHLERGRAFLACGHSARAVADLDEAIRAVPGDAIAHAERGLALLRLGHLDDAIRDCSRAIELDQGGGGGGAASVRAHDARGLAYDHKGQTMEALAEFDAAVRLDPRFTPSRINRARIHLQRGSVSQTMSELNEVLSLEPGNVAALALRGRAHNLRGQADEAIIDATAALRLDATDVSAYFQRAVALTSKGTLESALADYAEVIRLAPAEPNAFYNRGEVYHRQCRYAEAIRDYAEAIRLDARYVRAYFNRAAARRACGDRAGAEADLVVALQSDQSDFRDLVIGELVSLAPDNPALLAALPVQANSNGRYAGLRMRLYAPGDSETKGASYKDFGYGPFPHGSRRDLPKGRWVYVYPYWYLWERDAK